MCGATHGTSQVDMDEQSPTYGAQPLGRGAEMSLRHLQRAKTRSSLGERVLGSRG